MTYLPFFIRYLILSSPAVFSFLHYRLFYFLNVLYKTTEILPNIFSLYFFPGDDDACMHYLSCMYLFTYSKS